MARSKTASSITIRPRWPGLLRLRLRLFLHHAVALRDGQYRLYPLLASATHLSAQSPCIGRGSPAYTSGVDIDGEAWLNPPCMGADQFVAGGATGELSVSIFAAYTNVATGFSVSFAAQVSGPLTTSVWDFGDGVMVSNRVYASHAWAVPAFQYG